VTVGKKAAFSLIALVLGSLLAFGMAEIGVRILSPQRTAPPLYAYDSRVGSIPVPNQTGRVTLPGVYSYSFSNDALGLRVTGIVGRTRARARILVLGDSFAYGYGVSDHETFTYLLEQRLAQTPIPTAVMNAGNGGKGTDYALRFFETIGRDLKPDLTLLFFFANDFVDNGRGQIYEVGADGTLRVRPDVGSVYARKEFLRESRVYNWVLSWSQVANLLKTVVVGYLRPRARSEDERTDAVVAYPDAGNGWSNPRNVPPTKRFVEGLARAARDAGSDLLIFYVPSGDDVKQYSDTRRQSRDERTFFELVGPTATVMSLTAMLADSGEPLERLYYDEARVGKPNGHWTPIGHALTARFIEGPVTDRLQNRLGH
jgi:hypothetical protein